MHETGTAQPGRKPSWEQAVKRIDRQIRAIRLMATDGTGTNETLAAAVSSIEAAMRELVDTLSRYERVVVWTSNRVCSALRELDEIGRASAVPVHDRSPESTGAARSAGGPGQQERKPDE